MTTPHDTEHNPAECLTCAHVPNAEAHTINLDHDPEAPKHLTTITRNGRAWLAETTHDADLCDACRAAMYAAYGLCRATGSVRSTHTDRHHVATVVAPGATRTPYSVCAYCHTRTDTPPAELTYKGTVYVPYPHTSLAEWHAAAACVAMTEPTGRCQ